MQYILSKEELQGFIDKAEAYDDIEGFIESIIPEKIPNFSPYDIFQMIEIIKSHLL